MAQRRIRTMAEVGRVIRDERERQGLTQEQLCRKARVSRSWLVHVENGKPSIDLFKILSTFEALGLTLVADDNWPKNTAIIENQNQTETRHPNHLSTREFADSVPAQSTHNSQGTAQ